MKTIFRYSINSSDGINNISMPSDSNVISCGIADDEISIWAEVDTNSPIITKTFCSFGTGVNMDEFFESNYSRKFIGTVRKSNKYAFHIYEVVESQN